MAALISAIASAAVAEAIVSSIDFTTAADLVLAGDDDVPIFADNDQPILVVLS